MFFLASKSVLEMINEGLRGLWANLCEFIYPKIAEMYSVFINMSKLIYSDDLTTIYNKISLFLGIFMIFRLSFWLIEALINPDVLGNKEKAPGEMIKKVFLVVVLLGITPSIFKYAYRLQYEVVESNVIANIISNEKSSSDDENFGKTLSAELFTTFLRPTIIDDKNLMEENNSSCVGYIGTEEGEYRDGFYYRSLEKTGKLRYLSGNNCLTSEEKVTIDGKTEKIYIVDFDGLYAVAVGAFVFWMILMYCISLGTRYVQLIFLQVIAPIPIMGYLSTEKDNMFSKWVKQCTTTYLDVFIRLIIIHFTVWLITIILTGNSALPSRLSENGMISLFIVLGLLTFAKKAPELIQELLPKSVTKASGDFGLSWKKRTDAMVGGKTIYSLPKKAIGFAGAASLALPRWGLRAINGARYNAREDEKGYNKKLKQLYAERDAIYKDKSMSQDERVKALRAKDAEIQKFEKSGKRGYRRKLRAENSNYMWQLRNNKDLTAEERATLMEKITENANSGIGHRNQAVIAATSIIGGTLTAGKEALLGNKVSDIIKKTYQDTTGSIKKEEKWYANNDYTIGNVVKRTISQVQRTFGLETEGQATQYIVDSLDAEIKAEEEKISKMKESQKVYGDVISGIDAMETKGGKDLQKSKAIKLGNGTDKVQSKVLSTDVDLLENEHERVRTFSQQMDSTAGAKEVSASPDELKMIEDLVKHTCDTTGNGEAVRQAIMAKVNGSSNLASAFDTANVETAHMIKKFRADTEKLQAAAGVIYYLDEQANVPESQRRGYNSPDISSQASAMFRTLSSESNRSDCSFEVDISKITGIPGDKIPAYRIEEKMRELVVGKEVDENVIKQIQQFNDIAKDAFKEVTRDKTREVDNVNEIIQDKKHERQAFSTYSETRAAIEADKFGGGK